MRSGDASRLSEHTVAYAYVEYADGSGGKKRPVVVVSIDGEEIALYRITSKYFNKSEYFQKRYYKIKDLVDAGLDRQSWVDVSTGPLIYSKNGMKFTIKGRFTKRDIAGLYELIRKVSEGEIE